MSSLEEITPSSLGLMHLQRKILWWLGSATAGAIVVLYMALRTPANGESHAHAARNTGHSGPHASVPGALRVEYVQPTEGGIIHRTVQPGSAHSFQSAELFAKVSGYLKTQNVDIGSQVKRGDVLAEIDVPEMVQELERAKGNLRQAEAEVVQAKSQKKSAQAEKKTNETNNTQTKTKNKQTKRKQENHKKQKQHNKGLFA